MEYLIVIALLIHVIVLFDVLVKVFVKNKKLEQQSLIALVLLPILGSLFYLFNKGNNYKS